MMRDLIRIVVAQETVTDGAAIQSILCEQPDFEVVQLANPESLQRVISSQPLNVAVVNFPAPSHLRAAQEITQVAPGVKVVIVAEKEDLRSVLDCMSHGAMAYVLHEMATTDLPIAVREAAVGRRFLTPKLSSQMIDAYLQSESNPPPDPLQALTPREREVFHLAAEGKTNAEIADGLKISPRTVEIHRANAMKKLRLKNLAALVRFAIERGIL